MKKFIKRTILALVLLLVLVAVALHLFLDGWIKRVVETTGPKLTKVDVKLDAISVSLLSGSGSIHGLVIGNPEGFQSPSAIRIGAASLALKPASLLSDKIVVQSINVAGPEVTFETGLHGNNLKKILANLDETSGGGEKAQTSQSKPGKKLQVDEFLITGGRVRVSLADFPGKSASVALPKIQLKGLGQGPEGITPAELSKKVMQAIFENATKVANDAAADLAKGAVFLTTEPQKAGTNATEGVTKKLGDWFKKK